MYKRPEIRIVALIPPGAIDIPMHATTADPSDPAALTQIARGQVIARQDARAEATYSAVLAAEPDNAEALNFLAMCALGRGEFAAARERLEHALRVDPTESSFRKNLGIVQLAQDHAQEAVDTFDQVIAADPKELTARLHRAAAMERLGNTYDATTGYYRAIATAHAAFQWRTRTTTPVALQPLLRHAIDYIGRHRRQILLEAMQPVRAEYGAGSLRRVEAGLDVYLGNAPAAYAAGQHSSFFHVPGLSTTPFLDAAAMPGVERLAARSAEFATEFSAALAEPTLCEPYFGSDDLALLRAQGVLDGGTGAGLRACYLARNGTPEVAAQRACPHAGAAVDALPELLRIDGLGPNAFLAEIAPETYVAISTGLTNVRVGVEIPWRVDGQCTRRVAGAERTWRAGTCVVYDGSFGHALSNDGAGACSALVLDAWHPALTAAERNALPLLFDAISRFHLAAGVEPPFGG